MPKISTSSLAKQLNVSSKELFDRLLYLGYIHKNGEAWELTEHGMNEGGEYHDSQKYGRYIVWPEELRLKEQDVSETITATTIGTHFDVSANKINYILSELGWVKKDIKGWVVTDQGRMQGAVQLEHSNTGIPYVRWPKAVLNSKALIQTMKHVSGESSNEPERSPDSQTANETNEDISFREKFEAKHRAADGHFVRSKAEMLIDNYLYMAEIVHAYERKLPIEEDVYCDFYIPTKKVYIEYWGYENDEKYLARKKKKIEIYEKHGFNLIQLQDKEVQNLDDYLPRALLKFGITAY